MTSPKTPVIGHVTPLVGAPATSGLDGKRLARIDAARPRVPQDAPRQILFSEFVSEMHEVIREARRTGAVDSRGRDLVLYFGDMMRRLEDAVDLVNPRLALRVPQDATSGVAAIFGSIPDLPEVPEQHAPIHCPTAGLACDVCDPGHRAADDERHRACALETDLVNASGAIEMLQQAAAGHVAEIETLTAENAGLRATAIRLEGELDNVRTAVAAAIGRDPGTDVAGELTAEIEACEGAIVRREHGLAAHEARVADLVDQRNAYRDRLRAMLGVTRPDGEELIALVERTLADHMATIEWLRAGIATAEKRTATWQGNVLDRVNAGADAQQQIAALANPLRRAALMLGAEASGDPLDLAQRIEAAAGRLSGQRAHGAVLTARLYELAQRLGATLPKPDERYAKVALAAIERGIVDLQRDLGKAERSRDVWQTRARRAEGRERLADALTGDEAKRAPDRYAKAGRKMLASARKGRRR